MRPIDADALYDKAKTWYKNAPTQFRRIYRSFVDAIVDAPTIEPPPNDLLTSNALEAVRTERQRQYVLWGDQSGNSMFEWVSILGEEYGELCEAVNETSFSNAAHPDRGGYENIIKEATQVAAVAVAIIETAYRRKPEEEHKDR